MNYQIIPAPNNLRDENPWRKMHVWTVLRYGECCDWRPASDVVCLLSSWWSCSLASGRTTVSGWTLASWRRMRTKRRRSQVGLWWLGDGRSCQFSEEKQTVMEEGRKDVLLFKWKSQENFSNRQLFVIQRERGGWPRKTRLWRTRGRRTCPSFKASSAAANKPAAPRRPARPRPSGRPQSRTLAQSLDAS